MKKIDNEHQKDEKGSIDEFEVMPMVGWLWQTFKGSIVPLLMLPVLMFLVILNLLIVLPSYFLLLILMHMMKIIYRALHWLAETHNKVTIEVRRLLDEVRRLSKEIHQSTLKKR